MDRSQAPEYKPDGTLYGFPYWVDGDRVTLWEPSDYRRMSEKDFERHQLARRKVGGARRHESPPVPFEQSAPPCTTR